MNITQALNVALPEMPAKLAGQRYPRMHPGVVHKEHVEEGERIVRAVVPGIDAMYTFPAENWPLMELFDGERSYEEIARLWSEMKGVEYSADTIRDFAADVDAMNFWYKTPLEKNIKLMQKSVDERRKLLQQQQKKWGGDLALIKFPAIDPDRFLTWLYQRVRFMYTTWFTLLTLLAFGFTIGIFITHWSEIGYDTLRFYNFADKTWFDVAEFWIVGAGLLCIHEIGHGLTCKHYGARVPAMGFLLIYLTPAFYTDTTEGEVLGGQTQRLIITIAGVWAELILCAIVTPIWWATPPGTGVHDFCYLIILFTGIAVVLVNWNPLVKLDGYFILSEALGISDLKEASTLYLSSWVKKNIWRLPVEVPYVPKRRRAGYAVYATLSGMYSYSMLYVFASFIGNIFKNFTHDWAFIPEYGTALLIFSGRIRTLVNFMKFVYLDKKDRVRAWFTPRRRIALALGATVLVLLPIWHESAEGRFVVEPDRLAVVRALVPGTVAEVSIREGQRVEAGAPLFRMRNLELESKLVGSLADARVAGARENAAILRRTDFGAARQQSRSLAEQARNFQAEAANLVLDSPITGTVLTPRPQDLQGAYVKEGTELAEVADVSRVRARIYISEYDMNRFRGDSYAKVQVDGIFGTRRADSVSIAAVPSPLVPGLLDLSKYAGMKPPNFYVVDMSIANPDGRLAAGMVGTARIYGRRRSIAGFAWQAVRDAVGRKIW